MKTEKEIEQMILQAATDNARTRERVRGLAASHNADLQQWCARRRRRDTATRLTVAACLLVGVAFSSRQALAATPAFAKVATTSAHSPQAILESVGEMLQQS